MNGVTLYGLALFLPSIVNELGFSITHTQLVSVGPFGVAFVCELLRRLWHHTGSMNTVCSHDHNLLPFR